VVLDDLAQHTRRQLAPLRLQKRSHLGRRGHEVLCWLLIVSCPLLRLLLLLLLAVLRPPPIAW
jgi:hypothetical protein